MTEGEYEGPQIPVHSASRIVVGVDGSADSMQALVWAATEARLRSAVLDVVHVDFFRREALESFAPDVLHDEQAVLERAVGRAQTLEPDIKVEGRMCEPPAAEALLEVSEGAQMLVVGSRGLSGLKKLALGSVSAECAHHARCPVVIIRSIVAAAWNEQTSSDPVQPPEAVNVRRTPS